MQAHVTDLAAELGCIMEQKQGMPGMMFVEEEPPRIEGPTIRNRTDYYIMLHELGHVYHRHTQGRPPYTDKTFYFDNGVLKSEAQAWEYALDNAIVMPDARCSDFIVYSCIMSYHNGSKYDKQYRGGKGCLTNGNRHWVKFIWDEPDDYFWGIVERMKEREVGR